MNLPLLPLVKTLYHFLNGCFFSNRYGSALVYSLCGYLGMQFVLSMVRAFGAFATVTVTSLRKALTIALSFALFAKPFTVEYVYSGAVVAAGIYLNLAAKRVKAESVGEWMRAGMAWARKNGGSVRQEV